MKPHSPRGAEARYTRQLHEQLAQRERVVRRVLVELAPLWAGDHQQLGAALGRLMDALPLELDAEQLLALGRAAQEHATAQGRVMLAAARIRAQRRDADDLPRRISTTPLTLWDEDPALRRQAEAWATENAAMIQNLDKRTRTRIVEAVQRAGQGSSLSELSSLVVEELGKSRRNAELLARDQLGKLASDTARYQMERAGVTHYIWRAVGDERTRPEHRSRDGEVFRWDAPPADGHPGQAPLCRCYAEPVLGENVPGWGGAWDPNQHQGPLEYIDAELSDDAFAQEHPMSCGLACARMVLNDEGLGLAEQAIAAVARWDDGGIDPNALRDLMNNLDPRPPDAGRWRYSMWPDNWLTAEHFEGATRARQMFPLFANIGEHWVLVDNVENGIVYIRDPRGAAVGPGPGLLAQASAATFMEAWRAENYIFVFYQSTP